jgi:hypothetical protein
MSLKTMFLIELPEAPEKTNNDPELEVVVKEALATPPYVVIPKLLGLLIETEGHAADVPDLIEIKFPEENHPRLNASDNVSIAESALNPELVSDPKLGSTYLVVQVG